MADTDELVTIFKTRGLSALTNAYASVTASLSTQIERMDAAAEAAVRLYQAQQQLQGFRLPASRSIAAAPTSNASSEGTRSPGGTATPRIRVPRATDAESDTRRAAAEMQRMGRLQAQAEAENQRRTQRAADLARRQQQQRLADAERLRRQQEAARNREINRSGQITNLGTGYMQALSQALQSAGVLDSRMQRPIQVLTLLQGRARSLPPDLRAIAMEQAGIASGAIAMGLAGVQALQAIARAAHEAIDSLVEYSNQVRTLQSLTGASARESSAETTLFRGAGVTDVQAIRDVMRLTQDFQSQQGRAGLGRLGISISPDQNGITTLNQVISSIQAMPDGLRKAQLEEQVFGTRGVMALQPLLRMSAETRQQLTALGANFDTNVLPAVQRLQEQGALLGQTWMQGVILPFAAAALPIFQALTQFVVSAVTAFNNLNRAMRGALIPALLFAGVGASIALMVTGVLALRSAFVALLPILKANAGIDAFITAMQPGGIGRVLAAGAVAGIAIGGISYAMNQQGAPGTGGDKMSSAADKFGSAVDRFNSGVEDFKRFSKGGMPSELSATDVTALGRMGRLGAFG